MYYCERERAPRKEDHIVIRYHLAIYLIPIVAREMQQARSCCARNTTANAAKFSLQRSARKALSLLALLLAKREWKGTSSRFFHVVAPLHSLLSLFHFLRSFPPATPRTAFSLFILGLALVLVWRHGNFSRRRFSLRHDIFTSILLPLRRK